MLAEDNRQRAHKLAKIKADAEALAASLNGVSISIATKASESGKVFGSVTSVQIADTLAEKGFTVDRRLIALKEPLKELGAHKVVIKLHKEVSAEVEVVVVVLLTWEVESLLDAKPSGVCLYIIFAHLRISLKSLYITQCSSIRRVFNFHSIVLSKTIFNSYIWLFMYQ